MWELLETVQALLPAGETLGKSHRGETAEVQRVFRDLFKAPKFMGTQEDPFGGEPVQVRILLNLV